MRCHALRLHNRIKKTVIGDLFWSTTFTKNIAITYYILNYFLCYYYLLLFIYIVIANPNTVHNISNCTLS